MMLEVQFSSALRCDIPIVLVKIIKLKADARLSKTQLYSYIIYMYSGRWYFADQLHVSALYIGHHQVVIINLIGNYTNVHV